MNKKGIIITLGTFLIVFLVLNYVLLSYRYTHKEENTFSQMAALDRANDLYVSLQSSVIDSLSIAAGVNLTINKTNQSITVREYLNNTDFVNFINNLSYFVDFVESNYTEINFSFNDKAEIIVSPQDVYYSHSDNGEGNISISSLSARRYVLTFWSNNVNITEIDGSAGTKVYVNYYDIGGTYYNAGGFATSSSIDVDLETGGDVEIRFTGGKLQILNAGSYDNVSVQTKIEFGDEIDYVSLNDSSMSVDLGDVGVTKTGVIELS